MTFLRKILKKKEAVEKKEPSFASPSPEASGGHSKATEGKEVPKSSGGKIITGILRAPHITEKGTAAAKENKYVFSVTAHANKNAVKQAVEARYGVRVEAVNVLNTPRKERRRGKNIGWKPGYKKAIVTLEQGQTIEIQ